MPLTLTDTYEWTVSAGTDEIIKSSADVGNFLLRVDFIDDDQGAYIGVHANDATAPPYNAGYFEISLLGGEAFLYGAVNYANISPLTTGPLFIRRVGNTIDVRYGGTGWADATHYVDAALAAATHDSTRIWLVLNGKTDMTLTFLPLP